MKNAVVIIDRDFILFGLLRYCRLLSETFFRLTFIYELLHVLSWDFRFSMGSFGIVFGLLELDSPSQDYVFVIF